MPPRKSEILRSIEYYEKILPTLNVDIHLNEEVKDINNYDYALLAIGAHNMEMPIPHKREQHCFELGCFKGTRSTRCLCCYRWWSW